MGAWGVGLYSDDVALDLRTIISAICRLPKNGNEILDLLCELSPTLLNDPDEECTFWLVTADQLQRRGIETRAREKALQIIDEGTDIARLEALGMEPMNLSKRQKLLLELREKLSEPATPKKRRTMSKPQALVMTQGEIYAFPVDDKGNSVNPYMPEVDRENFIPTGWSSFFVARTGHAFGYLAWYQIVLSDVVYPSRPSSPEAMEGLNPQRSGVGTLSNLHQRHLRLESIGSMDTRLDVPEPDEQLIFSKVASDVSVANVLRPPILWQGASVLPPRSRRQWLPSLRRRLVALMKRSNDAHDSAVERSGS